MEWISASARKPSRNKTKGKEAARQRFALAIAFLSPVAPLVSRGFATREKGRTAMGRAMSYLLRTAMEGEYPDQWVNPAKVLLSFGNVSNPDGVELTRAGKQLKAVWLWDKDRKDGWDNQAFWDDEIILCAYNPCSRMAGINGQTGLREDGEVILTLPFELSSVAVEVYLLARSRNGQQYSRSLYLGRI